MKRSRYLMRVLTTLAVLVPAAAFAQTMYKWVDEKGVTHYSSEPPPESVHAKKIDVKPTPPSSSRPSDDPAAWKEHAHQLELERRDRESAEKLTQRAQAAKAERCRQARIAQDRLNNVQRLYRYDEKGERHYLSDDERPAELEKQRKIIVESC